jgi:hypothetical protein
MMCYNIFTKDICTGVFRSNRADRHTCVTQIKKFRSIASSLLLPMEPMYVGWLRKGVRYL